MIISDPANKEHYGSTCTDITELIDLYPTLTELCGLNDKQPEILQGESLAYAVKGEKKENKEEIAFTITSAKGASIRTDRWRYNRWGEDAEPGNEELYDHENDPEEHFNLADDSDKKDVLKEMREKFEIARKKARNVIN
jgi:arylsulfatase A-like enzyme